MEDCRLTHPDQSPVGRGGGGLPLRASLRSLRPLVTPRTGAAILLWRVEAPLTPPVAFALVASLGRWEAAIAMGVLTGLLGGLFLWLLRSEAAIHEARELLMRRRFLRRLTQTLLGGDLRSQQGVRLASLPVLVLVLGPFWRAVALALSGTADRRALFIAVVGSVPHHLLWTGLVVGSIWDFLLSPLF